MLPRGESNNDFNYQINDNGQQPVTDFLEVPHGGRYQNYSSDQSSHLSDSEYYDSSYYLSSNSENPSDFWSNGTEMVSELDFPIENPFPATTRNLIRNMSFEYPLLRAEDPEPAQQKVFDNQNSFGDRLPRMDTNDLIAPLMRDLVAKRQATDDDFLFGRSNSAKANLKLEQQEEAITGKNSPDVSSKKPKIMLHRAPTLEETVVRRKKISEKKSAKKESSKRSSRGSKASKSDTASNQPKKRRRYKQDSKNIVKNYGKAMSAFSLTELARPYRDPLLESLNVPYENFKQFIIKHKELIDSIGSLRGMILPVDGEEEELQNIKKIFRELSEIFVRDFAVNWIYGSKSNHKEVLLKYRFKILRRVQTPSQFTYLKNC